MLGSLDNEVIFKKAFTDKIVFEAFVKDILGIEIEVNKIETEKKFDPSVGYIDFRLDIFAETVDKRIVIEIQKVEYDHNFDRFLHYFLMVIAEQQRRAKDYGIDQTVYMIVVLTVPYTINEKNGKPVKDEVLVLKINPQTLKGEERELYNHQLVLLNPNHPIADTPENIRDWLNLIYQSIHHADNPVVNTANLAIKRVTELIDFDNLTPSERESAKNKEASKITIAKIENVKALEIARKSILAGLTNELIANITDLTLEQIQQLRTEILTRK